MSASGIDAATGRRRRLDGWWRYGAMAAVIGGLLAVAGGQVWDASPRFGGPSRSEAATTAQLAEPPAGPDPDAPPAAPPAAPPEADTHVIAYRVEVRTDDPATANFPDKVHEVLTDPRGWVRAGFEFVPDPDAPYRLVIAEGPQVDRLCDPYDTAGRFSCQNGPVVAINADRWRVATEAWPGSLEAYRTMLINHEVGHLLHLHHPDPQCPGPGLPAPVMAQQSGGPEPCRAHAWPLQWEIDLAAERREPLAPDADHDPQDHRPEPPRAQR